MYCSLGVLLQETGTDLLPSLLDKVKCLGNVDSSTNQVYLVAKIGKNVTVKKSDFQNK